MTYIFAPLLSATNKYCEEPLSQVSHIVRAALLAFVIWISSMTLQLALVLLGKFWIGILAIQLQSNSKVS